MTLTLRLFLLVASVLLTWVSIVWSNKAGLNSFIKFIFTAVAVLGWLLVFGVVH